jgi:50S ribosomal subunit-associated GTPase HflX
LFVFNKIDEVQDQEIVEEIKKYFLDKIEKKLKLNKDCISKNIYFISAAGRLNLDILLSKFYEMVKKLQLK